jgi:hypothetical protein
VFTFINSTVGARIAIERLKDRVRMMRVLRCEKVYAIAELGAKPFPTRHGLKQRPEFIILDWCILGGPTAASAPAIAQLIQPMEAVSLKEELNDEIGF